MIAGYQIATEMEMVYSSSALVELLKEYKEEIQGYTTGFVDLNS